MASIIATTGHNRRWSWDEDEDDDFDLDTWKATVDTSSPTAHDLGPLQLPPCEEKIENVVVDSLECHIYHDEYWEAPDSDMQDMGENRWPIIVSECECTSEPEEEEASPEVTFTNLVDMIEEEEAAIARHEYLTHAIGVYFEGKEEADKPAYPELSPYNGHRYRYAKAFQTIKYATGRRQGEVYQHSPLVFATSIDDAHLMDEDSRHNELCADEYEQETLEDILGYEDEESELEIPEVNFTVIFDESPKDMNEQVKLQRLPALDHFSQDELKELIGMWKAQQDKDGENCFEDDGDEDSKSVDTWERSDVDEEETFESLRIEYDPDSKRVTGVDSLEPEPLSHNEELDFNDVVFCVDYDIENRDEGYVSSSPPVSPVLDLFTDGGEWQREHSEAAAQPKGAVRVDSMDALDELGVVEEQGKASACSEEEDNPVDTGPESPKSDNNDSDSNNTGYSETTNHAESAAPVPAYLNDDKRDSSKPDAKIWQDISDTCGSSKTAPTLSNPCSNLYTPLEDANPQQPFQIQIVALASILFQGLSLHHQATLDEP